MIKEGSVLVKNKGAALTDSVHGPGDYFGEMALMQVRTSKSKSVWPKLGLL